MEFQREPFPLYTPVEGTLPKPPGELVQGMLFKDSDGSHGSELRVPHNLTEFMALAGVDRVLNRHGFKFIRAQIEAILKIHRFQKAVVASPTGTGKTYLALAAAARLIQEGKRVLFVTRQVKLVEQVLENAEDVLNLGDFKKAA
ncbi:MAG: DEAD/DEAH box helicase, partial [Candidatus Dadabacteria bacterium]